MKQNIGQTERVVRVAMGAFLISLAFWGPADRWFLLGLVPLITGLVGWCPPYSLLGFNTCKK